MAKLNQTLQQLFTKLGLDHEEVKKITGNTALESIDVSDDFNEIVTKSEYFTKESAGQNSEIRAKIKAEILNGEDARQSEIMKRLEFDEQTMTELMAEKNTLKRYNTLVDKVAELTSKKAKSSSADKDALTAKIADLNKEILSIKTAHEQALANERNSRKQDRINWEFDSIYSEFDYSLPTEKNISIKTAKAIMNEIMASKGLKVDLSENGLSLKNNDGTDFFENNKTVSPKDFVHKTLLENKLIKTIVEPDPSKTGQQYQRQGAGINNSSLESALDSRLNSIGG